MRSASPEKRESPRTVRTRTPVVRFLVVFVVLVLALSLLVRTPWFSRSVMAPYTSFISSTAGVLLGAAGVNVRVAGTTISHRAFAVDIRKGCDGLEATMLLVCATIAYPFCSSKRRWLALGSGYLVIFVTNMIRVVVLFLLGMKGFMNAFNFVHTYIAQFAVVTVVMIVWLFWVSGDRPPSGRGSERENAKQPAA